MIKQIPYIFWGILVEEDIQPDPSITCVMFEYIDRGIQDVKLFAELIHKWYPNVKSIWINQNYTYDNGTYTFNNLYIDLGLESLIVIAVQKIDEQLMVVDERTIKDNGLIAFLINEYCDNGYNEPDFEYFKLYSGDNYKSPEFLTLLDKASKFYELEWCPPKYINFEFKF